LSQIIGGRYATQGTFRASRVGSWFVLSDQDGQLRGGLRLNALDQAETQRLQGVLSSAPGLLNVVDQVRDHNGHWLITAAPATPTVAEALQARIGLPPAVALLIAVDTGQILVSLHDAGTAHGGLSADTVILSREGRVALAECGYAHALAGTHAGPGHDTTGWVKLLRGLATPRVADDAKRLLNAAADEAEALGGKDGLATAVTSLSHQAMRLPGYGERGGLAMLASMVSTAPAAPQQRTEDGATMAMDSETVPVENATVVLGPPPKATGNAAVPAAPVAPNAMAQTAIMRDQGVEEATMQPAQLAAKMSRQKEDVLRFGRGVAPLPQPQRRPPLADTGWAGDLHQQLPQRPGKRHRPWRARILGVMSALVTLVLVAWVGYQIIQRLIPLRVGGVTVALAEPLEDKCDVQARVVGTIRTNGAAGTISYRWLTSDGKTTAILNEQVNLGTSQVQVPLLWTFSGRSTIRAKATLHILTPSESQSSTEFTYSCK
jgi:hypothetical protein